MRVEVIEALSDNFMYLVIGEGSDLGVVVDPVEPLKVVAKAAELGVQIMSVLTTHHHWDHAGGNVKLLEKLPGIPVYGGDERVPGLSQIVQHKGFITVGSLNIQCLRTPCHTTGHVCYHITDPNDSYGAVFTGDTLFIGGCGRFFEGDAEQMYSALYEVLGTLPDETLVYCGHEYTVKNLLFAKTIEPNNLHIQRKLEWAQQMRKKNCVTVPSTIAEEKSFNPFMRVHEPVIQSRVSRSEVIGTMEVLRNMKNEFK